MDSPYAVGGYKAAFMEHLFELVACLVAVWKAGGGAYIAGYKEMIVFCNYTA
jgi:hypothetical protein